MNREELVIRWVKEAVLALYNSEGDPNLFQTQATRKEFEGDITAVIFPLLKLSKKSPEATGEEIGQYLLEHYKEIESYNVIKGFLNLQFRESYWQELFKKIAADERFGQLPSTGRSVMVEFSSPNTNKPLHLGHIRNILLGWSLSKLLEAAGENVIKVNLVNDRGIHICKSMLAWLKSEDKATPESSKIKGDHLVGNYYVAFNDKYKEEIEQLVASGKSSEEAEKEAPILLEAQTMLREWEEGESEVIELWKRMNSWVYDGFDKTYERLGVSFDKIYYESETYLLGKEIVNKGLEEGLFYKREDGSVWANLENEGLDEKLLLRGDGTSVYMTQDLGTANQRFSQYNLDEHIYVVGNEQNYHFQVLQVLLRKLGYPWAENLYHLSYGMVELPEGKMKSREGTVVDADDLIERMVNSARETSLEMGKLDELSTEERESLFEMIGLGALKYFIIKVDPKKNMLFDPKESIDFNGNTGPFIQYTHARICSILRRAESEQLTIEATEAALNRREIEIIKNISLYPERVKEAASIHSPAIIANYAYELAKEFNQYYHEVGILREENPSIKSQRLLLIKTIAKVLRRATSILGIELPERM